MWTERKELIERFCRGDKTEKENILSLRTVSEAGQRRILKRAETHART